MSTSAEHAVRLATVDDAEVLARLLWRFNTEFGSPTDDEPVLTARFRRILHLDAVYALLAGEEAGFALVTLRPAIWFDGPVAQLEELYVQPGLRGAGIGTELLAAARSRARERGAREMHINVDEVDTDTGRFYDRHGFVTVEPGTDWRMLCYVGTTG